MIIYALNDRGEKRKKKMDRKNRHKILSKFSSQAVEKDIHQIHNDSHSSLQVTIIYIDYMDVNEFKHNYVVDALLFCNRFKRG